MEELQRAIRGEHHKQALQAANKLISAGKASPDVIEAKVVALLHESKWENAVAACGTTPSLSLHRAYALYKADKHADALAALEGVPGGAADGDGVLHLRAQLLFRLNRFDECVGLYERVLASLEADPDSEPADVDDTRLNLAASLVGAGRAPELLVHARFADVVEAVTRGGAALRSLDAPYELLYNVGCGFVEDGQAGLALRALGAALRSGEALLREDGETAEGIADELAVIRAQAAYVMQRAHYDDAAVALYEQVASSRPSDASVAASVTVNLAQLRSGRELLETYKRIKALAPAAPAHSSSSSSSSAGAGVARLLRRQRLALSFNRALLSYRVRRLEEAGAALAEVRSLAEDVLGGGSSSSSSSNSSSSSSGGGDVGAAREVLAAADVLGAAISALAAVSPTKDGSGSGSSVVSEALARVTALATAASPSSSPPSPVASVSHALAAQVQLLLEEGRAGEAADALAAGLARGSSRGASSSSSSSSSLLVPPAVAMTHAQLLVSAGRFTDALTSLGAAIDGWRAVVATNATTITASKRGGQQQPQQQQEQLQAEGVVSLADLLHARACLRLTPGPALDLPRACDDYTDLAGLPGLPRDGKAAALACLAMVRAQQAASSPSASASASSSGSGLHGDAEALLREAAQLAGPITPAATPTSSRRGSFSLAASPSSSPSPSSSSPLLLPGSLDVDALEWAVAEPRTSGAGAGGGASSRTPPAAEPGAGAGAPGSTATTGAGGKTPAQAAARKRRQLARRAKAREAYLAALRSSGKYDILGGALPAPDPERWLPKRERTYGRKGGRRKALARMANVSSGGAQGAASGGLTEHLVRELDIKAKTDAAKAAAAAKGAAAGASSAAPAPSPTAPPSPALPPGAGKRKQAGKGGRR